jgi:hypothetical protein
MNANTDNTSTILTLEQKLSKAGIALVIQGIGHVPSFKNTKGIYRNKRTGKPFIATDPKKKAWMQSAIHNLESQLHGLFPIGANETHGEWRKRLQTASPLPLDDSLAWMIPGQQSIRFVNKGEEGAIIYIEKI